MAVKKWVGGSAGVETDVNTAANYSPSGVPTNGDDLYVEAPNSGTTYSMAASLSALSAVTLNSLNVSQTYTGEIGTATAYLQIGATTINIGYQYGGTSTGNGSPRVKLNVGSVQTSVNVIATSSSSSDTNAGPVQILGSHTSNAITIQSGTVTIAQDPTESATFRTINNSGNLVCGPSVTLSSATINNYGGSLVAQTAVSVVNIYAGTVTTVGTGTLSTANVFGGSLVSNSTGTITALNVNGTADFSQSPASRTVTTATLYTNAVLNVNNGVKGSVTFTNPIDTSKATQYTLTVWPGTKYTLS